MLSPSPQRSFYIWKKGGKGIIKTDSKKKKKKVRNVAASPSLNGKRGRRYYQGRSQDARKTLRIPRADFRQVKAGPPAGRGEG